MIEEEFNKLRFREVSNMTFDDRNYTIYECVSEPLAGRLIVCTWVKRDKQTGITLGEKPLIQYWLDGELYRNREEILETIKRI